MAMDIVVYSMLLKKIKGVATGVSTATYDGDTRSIVFTCNDGTTLRVPVPNGLSSAEIEMISHMTLEQEEDGSYYIAVDGERIGSKTCNFKTTTAVGSLPAGTNLVSAECADVLEQMLVAKFPPEITYTSTLSTSDYYEIGEVKDVTLDIVVNKKSYDLKKVEITSTPTLSGFNKNITTAPWTHSGSFSISNLYDFLSQPKQLWFL